MRFPCPNLLTAKLARTKPIFLSGLIVLTLLAQSHSFAQNDPRVKVNIGVDGNYKARTWATVALEIDPEIANMAPVDVVLTISQRQGHEVKTLRHYSASLSSHHGDAAAELSIPIYLTPNSNYIILQISKDGRRLLQQAHFLERLERGRETFVLVLTSQPESFNIIPSIKMRYDIKTMFLSPSSLGKDWTFYHALECVIVDNVKLSSLTAEQFDAFASWLYRGGNVVFTSAGLDANASDQRLKSLSGFEYSGRRTIMSPYALAAFCDEGPDSIERLDSLEIAAENRDIFLKTQETPLILRHEAGIGFLWALTFDPQEISLKDRSRSDPIVRKIWTTILERCKRNEGSVSWNESVAEAPQTKMQNVFGPVAVYLIVLVVVLGPINYALLRKLDRREFILLTIPVVTLLLGIGAFCAGLSLKGDKAIKVTRAVTVGKAGDTVFDHRRYVGVLSPRKGLFQLSALETDGHIPHVVDPIMVTSWDEVKKVGRFPLQMRYFGDRVKVSDIEIPMWGMKFLEFQSVAKHADAISCSLNLEHGVLTGRIESALPFPLKQCFIVSRHNKVSLGALEPRSGKDFELRILPPPSLDGIRLTAY
ncbi:hypothetical protein HZA56_10565, partial [Candidatus Poribacteria bacterium]|nr:hypothetical protein [Candidatus Poribacteria bacterium]